MEFPPLTGRDAAVPPATGAQPLAVFAAIKLMKPKSGATAAVTGLLVAVIFIGGLGCPEGWNLVLIVVCLSLILLVLGNGIVDRPLGFLIDEYNIMSLARLQMALWTIVVISSYLAYALARIRAEGLGAAIAGANGSAGPLDVKIDAHLLELMGLSATSFVASPLILGTKKDKDPAPMAMAKTSFASGDTMAEINANRVGTIYANTSMVDAKLTDLFQGDEVGNTMHVDLAKVQMFFFAIAAALAYLILVFRNLRAPGPDLTCLPVLSEGVVYALGISHAGYLASKGVNHTPEAVD